MRAFIMILVTVIFALFVLAVSSWGAVLVCDPQAGVTQYRIEWDGGAVEYITAEADGSLRYDVAAVSIGNSSGSIYAGKPYMLDGVPQDAWEWSDPRPFALGKPSSAEAPANVRLISN